MNGSQKQSSVGMTTLRGFALAAAFLLLTAASFRRLWGADFWWQYATGRLVAEAGIPRVDVFSYTMTGQPWIEMRWLYCYVLYYLKELVGAGGVVAVKWMTLTASFSLVTIPRFSRKTATACAAVVTIAILASSQRFFVRPELVTYLLIAVFVSVIDRFRRRGGKLLFLLPVLQVVWTNSHTLFLFGPLLVGLLAVVTCARLLLARRSQRETSDLRHQAGVTILVFGLTTLACLINPYGFRGLVFPLRLFEEIRGSVFKDSIGEFRSPFSFSQSYAAVTYYEVLIAICAASAAVGFRRLDPFWTTLLLAQLYLSGLAIRNLPLFSLAAIPFVVHNVRSLNLAADNPVRAWLPRLETLGAAVVIVVGIGYSWDLATDRFNVRQDDTNQFGAGLAEHRFPEEAVRFLGEQHLEGPLFHTMREGAFLLAHGYEVFIDPRLEVYGEEHFARYMQTVSGAPGWEKTLREYDIRAVVLELQSALVEPLFAAEGWTLVHFDETAAVFARADRHHPAPIRTEEDFVRAVSVVRRQLPEPPPRSESGWLGRVRSPKPYKRVAEFLVLAGFPELALPFFEDAVRVRPDDLDAYRGCVWAYGYTGDSDAATTMLEAGLRRWRGDPWMQYQLGVHYFNHGRVEDASALVRGSLLVDPTNAAAWALLAMIHASREDFPGAADAADRAVGLEPSNPRYRKDLETYRSMAGR